MSKVDSEIAQLKETLRSMNPGRNLDSWPVCSFGGKDADLEPFGSTGIADVQRSRDGDYLVSVGGYKTVCPQNYEDKELTEEANDMITDALVHSGFRVEWTGDEWTIADEALVKIAYNKHESPYKTALAILQVAETQCSSFEKRATIIDKSITAMLLLFEQEKGIV